MCEHHAMQIQIQMSGMLTRYSLVLLIRMDYTRVTSLVSRTIVPDIIPVCDALSYLMPIASVLLTANNNKESEDTGHKYFGLV